MERITHLERAVAQAKALVAGVRDDQLSAPTPCTEWDVKALLGHLLGGALIYGAAAREGKVPKGLLDEAMAPDVVGDDFRERLASAGDAMVEAFRRPGALEETMELPFGTLPGRAVLNLAAMDTTIHAADLAHATGQSFDDTGLAEATLELGRKAEAAPGSFLRAPNVLGPEHPCADDAPAATRLLAFAGRKV